MTDRLTPQNVTITTATIEVKTLTLGKRQITQSVFRQLREEPLISEDGTLNGDPWGYVNHCPDKKVAADDFSGRMIDCAIGPDHRHVVWQKGDELRRSRVVAFRSAWYPFWSETTDVVVQAAYCAGGHVLPEWVAATSRQGGEAFDFRHDGMKCSGDNLGRRWDPGHECKSADDLNRARAELSDEITKENALRSSRRAAWKVVTELPQLFIAV